jgi:hypothetical protein
MMLALYRTTLRQLTYFRNRISLKSHLSLGANEYYKLTLLLALRTAL